MKRPSATDVVLLALVICYFMVVGADLFAQMSITPAALAAPPGSLAMFQGDYVYDGAPFWRITTSLALLLFAITVLLNWRTNRRSLLLTGFVAFVVLNVVSWLYIFPEYLSIVGSAYSDTVDAELVARGAAWRRLAGTRWVIAFLIGLFPSLALMQRSTEATAAS